jgi:hypothetical protein
MISRAMSILAIAAAIIPSTGCTRTISARASLSEGLVASIQPIQAADVSATVSSNVKDGEFPTTAPEGTRADKSGDVYVLAAATLFKAMGSEFLADKFPNAKADQPKKAALVLEEVVLQRYSNDSSGSMIMAGLAGGEINWIQSVSVRVTASVGGVTRTIKGSADDTMVDGIGTGTQSSAIYKGENSQEMKFGRAFTAAINKALALSNAFFEQNR